MPMKRFLIATAILSLTAGTALASPTGETTVSLSWTSHLGQGWSQRWDMPPGIGVGQVQGADSGGGLGVTVWHQQPANDILSWGVGGRIGRGTSTAGRTASYLFTNVLSTQRYTVSSPINQRVIYETVRGGLDFHPISSISATVGINVGHTNLKTITHGQEGSTSRTALKPMLDVLWIANWGSVEVHYDQQPWIMPATHAESLSPIAEYPSYAAPRRLRISYWTTPEAWGSVGLTAALYRPDTSRPILETAHRLGITYESPDRDLDIEVGRVEGYTKSEPDYLTPGLPALVAAVAPMHPWRAYMEGVYASATVHVSKWQVEGIVMAEAGQVGAEHTQTIYLPQGTTSTVSNVSTTLAGGTYLALRVAYTW